ncbi:hypothetical protein [Aquisalimonas asiatica]|uniref:Uncharacterized protein n=1 Tax=Aquisalimonas asiatica TaxID=406100 RepID=A0A1H8TA70_9GAMM|nr:hypothetical protein [Aquisalimonas asiatica]SEO88029.1 hypothetical protein SAMN04488052_10415 [Aquisalimonas asiatica]
MQDAATDGSSTRERAVRPSERRELTFTARRAEDGVIATVSVYRVDGHGRQQGEPIASTDVTLRAGQTEYVAPITLPDGGGGCCSGGDQAAGLRFDIKSGGTRNRTASPLARVLQPLRLHLQASPDLDWSPAWNNARITILDRDTDVRHEGYADANGNAVDDEVRILPGTPAVFRIDGPLRAPLRVKCLPPVAMVNLRHALDDSNTLISVRSGEERS